MTPTIVDAVSMSLGAGLTSSALDRKRAVMALRAASTPAERAAIMALVVEKRATHRAWITVTQRRWQDHTRHYRARTVRAYALRAGGIDRAPARVRESIATREQYVRCAG